MTLTVYWPIGPTVYAAECNVLSGQTVKFVKDVSTVREYTQCENPNEAEAFCKSLMQGEMVELTGTLAYT